MEVIRYIRGKKPSSKVYQLRLNIKETDTCCICKKSVTKKNAEIEHTIPVSIGGDVDTFEIYCKDCHIPKTRFDTNFIYFLKKVGLLINVCENEYLIQNKQKIIELYKEFRRLL